MQKRLLLAALLVLAACARQPIREEVTITFADDADLVEVTSETSFELEPKTPRIRARVDEAREAAIAGTDAWAVRFARVTPERERVIFDRERGMLAKVTRSGRIPPDDLQRLFSDASLTVHTQEGAGWRELAIYPASSTRATRDQRLHFANEIDLWSRDVARYFSALHHLYRYLDGAPERAQYVFANLLQERGPDLVVPGVTETEEPLVNAVSEAMEAIGQRMEIEQGRAFTLEEEADLIYNPFPSRLRVRVTGTVTSMEGFTATKDAKEVVVEPIDLLAVIAALEGRWISPDPLAVLMRTPEDKDVSAKDLAALPRTSQPVSSPSEVATAITEQFARPKTYVVRWRS